MATCGTNWSSNAAGATRSTPSGSAGRGSHCWCYSVLIVHVVIMGCGRVGSTLARSLEDRNHTVAVLDSEPDSFRRLGPGFKGDKIPGMGFDPPGLEKAGRR